MDELNIELQRVTIDQKSVLRNLLELYRHDHAEWDDTDLDEHGLYGYKYLDNYWTEEGRHAFFIRVNDKLAGFTMIRDSSNTGADHHHMAEFFILRKYRRMGIGRIAVHRVFDMFPGLWRIPQVKNNLPGQKFWRQVISEYTNGRFREISDPKWDGPIQEFYAAI